MPAAAAERELDWVRAFYMIRMQAEGPIEKESHSGETAMSQIASVYLLKDGQMLMRWQGISLTILD